MGGNPPHRRLDVQGVRALAVAMVVAYHAGLPLPGGFVGVDVFFVVSGFVIAGMLLRERAATGRIAFGAFYLRRFRRLTPALALVVAVTVLFSSLALSPLGAQQTAAETGAGALLLAANAVIAASTGGYFDAPAEANPLLHTWTLSVEEQFYLAFPALLALGWALARRARHTPAILVAVVALGSFALADLGTAGGASSWLLGFYSPLTRAWEFAAGALLALLAPRARLPRVAALAGAALLAASLLLIDEGTPFPGAWTLLPVGAAVLLIHARSAALSLRPLVWIGDRSYSIYLWHWPFVAFAAALWPEAPAAPALAALASLVPAALSYRFVEEPLRRGPLPSRSRLAALVAAAVLAPLSAAVAVSAAAERYWTPRYEAGEVASAHPGDVGQDAWHRHLGDAFHECTPRELRERALAWEGVVRCRQSRPGEAVTVALVGDSHAEHLFPGLAEALPDENVAYYIRDDALSPADPEMARIVEHVAASRTIRTVVVGSLWSLRGVRGDGLPAALAALGRGKRLFVADDGPYFSYEPFGCKYRQALLAPTECSMDARGFRREYARYAPTLRRVVAAVPGATLLRTAHYFCDERECAMTRGGRLLFRDRSHLNLDGSRYVARRLLADHPELAGVRAAR